MKDTATPFAPAPPLGAITNVAGTWEGSYNSSQIGYGRATLSMTQSGGTVGGTWSTTPSAGGGNGAGAGTISGVITTTSTSGTFALTFSPSDPRDCPFRGTMTASLAQKQITGDWVSVNCSATVNAGLILTKIS
jgi:hypothetical protein